MQPGQAIGSLGISQSIQTANLEAVGSSIVPKSVVEVAHEQNEMQEFSEAFGLLERLAGFKKC